MTEQLHGLGVGSGRIPGVVLDGKKEHSQAFTYGSLLALESQTRKW